MPKSIKVTIFICLCLTSTAFAQYSLDEFPLPVGGHINDEAGLPIENASVTFIDQASSSEYTGITDASGWYGNLGYSAVPNVPRGQILGNAYPNPFGNATSIEIQTGTHEKSSGSESGTINIFDLRGRKVGSAPAASGTHEVITTSGVLANGTYFYRFAGETKKMVGSPKFITIKTISSSGHEKTVVEYGIQISAVGYEVFAGLVSMDDSQANYHDFNLSLNQSHIPLTLFGDAWNLIGDNPLRGGTVHIQNAAGQLFTAVLDSSFSLPFTVLSSTEEFKVWVDHPEMSHSGVMFKQQGLAVRHRVGQAACFCDPDTMRVSGDNPYLGTAVRYKGVDTQWAEDVIWQGLLYGTHVTRGEDRPEEDGAWRLEGWTFEYDISQATIGDPINQWDIDDFTDLVYYKQSLLIGGQPDGTVYGNVDAVVTDSPAGGFDVGYLFIDPTAGPNNHPYTEGGYLELFFSSTPFDTAIGTKAAEFFGEELTDIDDSLALAIYPDGTLEPVGLAAFNAHYLFDDGTHFWCYPGY